MNHQTVNSQKESSQRTHIIKANSCLKVENVYLKLALQILG